MRPDTVGSDTASYFKHIITGSFEREFLFNVVLNVFKGFGLNKPQFVLSVFSLLINASLAIVIILIFGKNYKYQNIAFVVWMLMPFTILFNINVVRQGVGQALLLVGIVGLQSRKKGIYMLPVFLGNFFHYSIPVFTIVYFFAFFKPIKVKVYVLVMLLMVVFSNSSLFDYLMGVVPNSISNLYNSYSLRTNLISYFLLFYFYGAQLLFFSFIPYREKNQEFYIKLILSHLILGAIVSQGRVFSTRFVIGIDMIIPAIYFMVYHWFDKTSKYFNNAVFIVVIIAVFIIMNSVPIVSNFSF